MLEISENTKVLIKILVDRAYENPISLEEMYEIMNGKKNPIGDNPDYSCTIKGGYRAVFSVEQHPSHLMKHISISHNGAPPSPEDVQVIISEFGFKNNLNSNECIIYLETQFGAINILEIA